MSKFVVHYENWTVNHYVFSGFIISSRTGKNRYAFFTHTNKLSDDNEAAIGKK